MILHRHKIAIVTAPGTDIKELIRSLASAGVLAFEILKTDEVETPEDQPAEALRLPSKSETDREKLEEARQEAADQAFEAHLEAEGEDEVYEGSDGWSKESHGHPETTGPYWQKTYYVGQKEDRNADSIRKSFSLTFKPNSTEIAEG